MLSIDSDEEYIPPNHSIEDTSIDVSIGLAESVSAAAAADVLRNMFAQPVPELGRVTLQTPVWTFSDYTHTCVCTVLTHTHVILCLLCAPFSAFMRGPD